MSTMSIPVAPRAAARSTRCAHSVTHGYVPQRNDIRLTHRGRLVVVLGLVAMMMLLVIAGALRATAAPTNPPSGWVPAVVQPGDTLWGLAESRADGDPRELIADIKAINGLVDSRLVSGQHLLLPG